MEGSNVGIFDLSMDGMAEGLLEGKVDGKSEGIRDVVKLEELMI